MKAVMPEKLNEAVGRICGDNVELSDTVVRLLVAAYEKGRCDAYDELGLDMAEFTGTDDAVAWTI